MNFGLKNQAQFEEMVQQIRKTPKHPPLFAAIYRTHLGTDKYLNIVRKKYNFVKEVAQDCRAEAVGKFLDALADGTCAFKENQNLEAYFLRTLERVCLDHLDETKKKHPQAQPDLANNDTAIEESFMDTIIALEMSVKMKNILQKAMNKLCEDCQKIVRWKFFRGLDHSEIAAKLRLEGTNPANSVSQRLKRDCMPSLEKHFKYLYHQ